MADSKKGNRQSGSETSSEGFGFKQSPLGFDKNEVNLYINKLKKQMKEMEIDCETKVKSLEASLATAKRESNEAKAAAREAEYLAQNASTAGGEAAPAAPSEDTKKIIDELKEESDKKIMELRKLVLDERRNVAKLDKACATAQMSEKKVREEYDKLKNKYLELKKSGSGGKSVTSTNAAELLDEAASYAEEIIAAAKAYSDETVSAVNKYKSDIEKELKERSGKLASAKQKIDEQAKKAEAQKAEADAKMKTVAEKIAALTGIFDSFSGQLDEVNSQVGKVTESISTVTDSISNVTDSITNVTNSISTVTDSFGNVTKQISDASKQLDGFAGSFEAAKNDITGMTKLVTDAKSSIDSVKGSIDGAKSNIDSVKGSIDSAKKDVASAKEAVEGQKSAAIDAAELTSAAADLSIDFSAVSATLTLPEFDTKKFSKSRLEELKSKLKIETKYEEGGNTADDDEEFLDDGDIISSIEIDAAPIPSDDDLMADMPDVVSVPNMEESAPVEEAVAAPSEPEAPVDSSKPAHEEKAEISSDFEDFFVTAPSATPLENRAGVGAIDNFTLDKEPEPVGLSDFIIEPNDLTAAPEKGADLGEDIFDMAINPVGTDDDTLNNMMAEAEAAAKAGDFELTPANINKGKDDSQESDLSSDFGEFADLFAAGSSETTAPTEKKGKAPFRMPVSDDDDMFNFGSDSTGDDSDLSADSALSEISDLLI